MIQNDLQAKIKTLLETIPPFKKKAVQQILSNRYKNLEDKSIGSQEEALVYLITRLPATYAVSQKVLTILKEVYPSGNSLVSFLDLGAGIGASRFLVNDLFPTIETITMIERNPYMYGIGQSLDHPRGSFIKGDYQMDQNIPPHDLVFLSYTFSELPKNQRLQTLEKIWSSVNQAMVLIEPGTPDGFLTLKEVRHHLVEWGGFIVAPCGHEGPCPISSPDWCHFSCRLTRSKEHLWIKEGTKAFEDEKFSYLIVTKEAPLEKRIPRIIRPPLRRKGHTILDLCTKTEIERRTLTASKDSLYKDHRQLEWGDSFYSSDESSVDDETDSPGIR